VRGVNQKVELALKDKVVIVIGGARGIWVGIVEAFAREKCRVVIGYNSSRDNAERLAKRLMHEEDTVVATMKIDVTSKIDAENLVRTTMKTYGRIDVLVTAAGVLRNMPFVDIDEEEWHRVMNINAKGAYLIAREVIPHMIKAKQGSVVIVLSRAAKDGTAGLSHYAMSKFALWGMTQSLAKEVAQYGINVNGICPGIIRTDMWETILDDRSRQTGVPKEEIWQQMMATIPMGVPQEPIDIGNLAVFLCSDAARYITGEAIHVNGGMRMD